MEYLDGLETIKISVEHLQSKHSKRIMRTVKTILVMVIMSTSRTSGAQNMDEYVNVYVNVYNK